MAVGSDELLLALYLQGTIFTSRLRFPLKDKEFGLSALSDLDSVKPFLGNIERGISSMNLKALFPFQKAYPQVDFP